MRLFLCVLCGVLSVASASLEPSSFHTSHDSVDKSTDDLTYDVGGPMSPFGEELIRNNDIATAPPVKATTVNRLQGGQIQFDKYGYPIFDDDESLEKMTDHVDTDETELEQMQLDEVKVDENKTNQNKAAETENNVKLSGVDFMRSFRSEIGCKANYTMIMMPLIMITVPLIKSPLTGNKQEEWCAEMCRHGYIGIDRYCVKGHVQIKESYYRGVGEPFICNPGLERSGLLCYPRCKDGYHGVGPVCWELCKEGYEGKGVYCSKTGHWYFKKSYTRGWGKPLSERCAQGLEQSGLICYHPCDDGFHGVGPVCWKPCPDNLSGLGPICYKGNYYERNVYKYE